MIYRYTQISQYLRCPRSYRYRYLDGWQEKDTHAAIVFGRCFEKGLAAYFCREDPAPESSAIRQRRYPRLRLEHPVSATTTNLKENYEMEIPEMTLGAGVAVQSLHPGASFP